MSDDIALMDACLFLAAIMLWSLFGAAPALVGLLIALALRSLIAGLV